MHGEFRIARRYLDNLLPLPVTTKAIPNEGQPHEDRFRKRFSFLIRKIGKVAHRPIGEQLAGSAAGQGLRRFGELIKCSFESSVLRWLLEDWLDDFSFDKPEIHVEDTTVGEQPGKFLFHKDLIRCQLEFHRIGAEKSTPQLKQTAG